MSVQPPDWQFVVERLERVERALRWWRRLGVAGVGVLGLLVLWEATSTKVPNEVRARRFVVVDANGKEAGRLVAVLPGWPALSLGYKEGSQVELGGGERPYLTLFHVGKDKSVPSARLALEADGSPSLELMDAKDQTRAVLYSAGLGLFDKNGKVIRQAP